MKATAAALLLFALLAFPSEALPKGGGGGAAPPAAAAPPAPASPVSSVPGARFAYVPNQGDSTVSIFGVDPVSGRFRAAGYAATGGQPYDAAVSGPYLYVSNIGGNTLSAYAIDPAGGGLTPLAGSPYAAGLAPAIIAPHPTLGFVYVANRGSNNISAWIVDPATGELSAVPGSPFDCVSNPYGAVVDPSGRFLYVASPNDHAIGIYGIDPATGGLAAAPFSPLTIDAASPLDLHIDANFLVASNGPTGAPMTFSTAADGSLTPTGAAPATGGNWPWSIALDPRQRFAYAIDAVDHKVTSFSFDPATGALALTASSPVGIDPYSVTVDGNGLFAYVVDDNTNAVTSFSIDQATGLLTRTGTIRARSAPFRLAIAMNSVAQRIQPRFAYVANNGSHDVSGFAVDPLTGGLAPVPGSPFPAGDAYALGATPSGRFVYSVNVSDNSISGFEVDPDSGELTPTPGSPYPAAGNPNALVVEASGRFAYAPQGNQHNVQAYSVLPTGALQPLGPAVPAGNLPQCIALDPSGRYAYVGNYGNALISVYRIDPASGQLIPLPGASIQGQPISAVVDATGRTLYVGTNSNSIWSFAINTSSGGLTPVGPPIPSGQYPNSLATDAAGRFVYSGNVNSSDISVFSIDESAGGRLQPNGATPTGSFPYGIAVDPSGRFAYTPSLTGGSVSGYSIDVAGLLHPVPGSPFPVGDSPRAVLVTGGPAPLEQPIPSVAFPTTVPATGQSGATVLLDASASVDPNGLPLSFAWSLAGSGVWIPIGNTPSITPLLPIGNNQILLVVSDSAGLTQNRIFTVTVQGLLPLIGVISTPDTVPATGPGGATVILDGSGSSDPNGLPLSFEWMLYGAAGWTSLGTGPVLSVVLPVGDNTLRLDLIDTAFQQLHVTFVVTVADTTPPVLWHVPDNVVLNRDSQLGAVYSLRYPDATDLVDGIVPVSAVGLPADGVYPVGPTVVFWSATDAAHNVATATTTVTVLMNPSAITLNPNAASLAVGSSALFSASGFFVDGSTQPLPSGPGTWSALGDLMTPRRGFGAAALNGALIAVGGDQGNGAVTGMMETMDPAIGVWMPLNPPMQTPRMAFGLAAMGGKLYAAGGQMNPGAQALSSMEIYEEGAGWHPGPGLPAPRADFALCEADGRLYAVGGTRFGQLLSSVDIFDPMTNQWAPGPDLQNPRRGAVVLARNGVLYAIGGAGADGSPIVFVERWNTAAPGGGWTSVAPLPEPRTGASGGVLNGTLYLAGGSVGGQASASVLAYDPDQSLWTPAPPLLQGRADAQGVVLGGQLFVIGGRNSGLQVQRTTQAFTPGGGVYWSSDSPGVASVDGGGIATAQSPGTALVTAALGGVSAAAVVTVHPAGVLMPVITDILGVPPAAVEATSAGGADLTFTSVVAYPNPEQLTYQWIEVSRNDQTLNETLGYGPTLAVTLPVGTLQLELIVEDPAHQQAIQYFTVTVQDTTPPKFVPASIPWPVTVGAQPLPDGPGAQVFFNAIQAGDLYDPAPVISTGPVALQGVYDAQNQLTGYTGFFPLGTTVEMFTATDQSGNPRTVKVSVTVVPALQSIDVSPQGGSLNVGNTLQYSAFGNFTGGPPRILMPGFWFPAPERMLQPGYPLWGAAGVINGTIYVVGGGWGPVGSNQYITGNTYSYQPFGAGWTLLPDVMNVPRQGHCVAVVDGALYAIGGLEQDQVCSNAVEVFRPGQGWTPRAPMPTRREWPSAAVVDGIIYVIGGDDHPSGAVLPTVEAYDPVSDTWSAKAPRPLAVKNAPAVAINNVIYAAGGSYNSGASTQVDFYDPLNDRWKSGPPMSTPRAVPAYGVVGGRLYLMGGSTPEMTSSSEVFDPLTNAWTTLPAIPNFHYDGASAVLNGAIYAMGGHDGVQYIDSIDAYRPGDDVRWSSTQTSVATIDPVQGLATAVGGGQATLRADLAGVSGSSLLTVNFPTTIQIVGVPDSIHYGDPLNFHVVVSLGQHVPPDGTPINLTVDGVPSVSGNTQGGVASFFLPPGFANVGHRVLQVFSSGVSASQPVLVLPGFATITLSNLSQTYNGLEHPVTVTVNPPTAHYTVTYDGQQTVPANAGSYVVVATVADLSYVSTSDTQTLTIAPQGPAITTFDPISDQTYGNPPVTLHAVTDLGVPVTFELLSGPANLVFGRPDVRLYLTGAGVVTVRAIQLNDNNHVQGAAVIRSFNVAPALTSITLSSAPNPSTVGQAVTLLATVAPVVPGLPGVSGLVQFYDGSSLLGGQVTVVNGQAVLSGLTLPVGSHTIGAAFSPTTPDFAPSSAVPLTQVVNGSPVAVALAVTPNATTHSTVFGQVLTLKATVSPVSTGSVQFFDGQTALGAPVALSGTGTATLTGVKPAAGPHSFTAGFIPSGASAVASSSPATAWTVTAATTTTTMTVTPASARPTAVFGESMNLKATIKVVSPGSGTPSGQVQFYDAGAAFGPAVTVSGTTVSLTMQTPSVGTHSFMAVFTSGSANLIGSTSPSVSETVDPASTSTTLTITPNSSTGNSVIGQPLTLKATVKVVSPGAGVVSGQVQFLDTGDPLGIRVDVVNGVATLPGVTPTTGTHQIRAVFFSATPDLLDSTSAPVSRFVSPSDTTTVLAVTPAGSPFYGQTLTLSATVAPVAPGAGAPTGSVQFSVDGVATGSPVPVSGGHAAMTLTPPAGTYSLTAAFATSAGDFNDSASSPVSKTVKPDTTTTTLTAAVTNTYAAGQTATFLVTVAANVPGQIPAGAVTLTVNGGSPVTAPLDAAGTAVLVTGPLAKGTATFQASFAAAPNFAASTSAKISKTVK